MQPSEKIQQYCSDVCGQIRWKKAKPTIAAEMEQHICDQRDAYMSNGDEEDAATQKALEQMGDAVSIGQELDQIHRPKPQRFMIALTGILMLTGLFIQFIMEPSLQSPIPLKVFPYALAFGVLVCCYYADFTVLGKYARKIYGLVTILSVIGTAMVDSNVNGRLILYIGRFSVSLAYLSFLFPLVFALLVYSMRQKGFRGILISEAASVPLAAVLLCVPTMSGLLLFMAAAFIILCFAICRGWFGGSKKKNLLLFFISAIAGAAAVLRVIPPYGIVRIKALLHPFDLSYSDNYMYLHIKYLLSESVFWGKGKTSPYLGDAATLPCIRTDYSLVYLTHQFGFAIFIGISLLVLLFAVVGIRKAWREKSVLGSLVALAIITTLILQSVLYILCNLGVGMVSSLSLPFLSYGNAALVIDAALTGFMLSVFRTGGNLQDDVPSNFMAERKSRNGLFSYEDGKLIINLKGSQN